MIHHGDLFTVLPTLNAESIDACVTDPPYELGFMGRKWDSSGVAFQVETWREVYRVLKPGAHLVAFGGTRTFHRMTVAIEDAGFEIRDCLSWLYGSGFPKSLNIGDGRGTALKPAWEPIILARKPTRGTVAANVTAYGTGALNIDACRIEGVKPQVTQGINSAPSSFNVTRSRQLSGDPNEGRWPANVCLDEHAAAMLDAQSGEMVSRPHAGAQLSGAGTHEGWKRPSHAKPMYKWAPYDDRGGASRFYYVAKPSQEERNFGTADRSGGARNTHPTVKPVELMRWLVRLVTPAGGTVLDPFAGSGTTGMACRYELRSFMGIEREAEYIAIAERRIGAVAPLFGEQSA